MPSLRWSVHNLKADAACFHPQASYELFRRTVAALPPGPLHLVVLSGIPLIFPKASCRGTVICARSYVQLHLHMWAPSVPNALRCCAALSALSGAFGRSPSFWLLKIPLALCPTLQVPAAETLLGCIGRVTRSVPALKNAARSSGKGGV